MVFVMILFVMSRKSYEESPPAVAAAEGDMIPDQSFNSRFREWRL